MNHEQKGREVEDHISSRYALEKRLGRGAYGIVWKVREKTTGRIFALKKIFDAFRNSTDSQRTYREICFLKEFSVHPNVIKLFEVFKSYNKRDIYLIFEFMATDLDKIIRKGNLLDESHMKYITYQVVRALAYIHSANVVHRDLKPSNILVNEHCVIKICDFGMARSVHCKDINEDTIMTDYVATRWYRAPEILLGSNLYTTMIDMWSLGCILGEMIRERPLFPGTSTLNQLDLVLKAVPPATKEDLACMRSSYTSSILSKYRLREIKENDVQSLVGRRASAETLSILLSLLKFNPNKRISAINALEKAYFQNCRNKSHEILLDYDLIPPIQDNIKISEEEYRKILFDSALLKELKCRRIFKGDKGPSQPVNHVVESSNPKMKEPADKTDFQKTLRGFIQYLMGGSNTDNGKLPTIPLQEESSDSAPSIPEKLKNSSSTTTDSSGNAT